MSRVGLLVALGLGLSAVSMQSQKSSGVVSPEVLPNHTAILRLSAPAATAVTVSADFPMKDGVGKMVKDDQGVWSFTTPVLRPDLYSYAFSVDGVKLPDPLNGEIKPGVKETQSLLWIRGVESAVIEEKAVPHGEVISVYYQAATLGKTRRMHVYLPPGYEAGKGSYPVVYLFHGGGDTDDAWESIGRVNFALDNLIAEGKAKPMVVVMPSLWALDPPVDAAHGAENLVGFQKTLMGDVIPYVESHFRVMAGAEHRAAGGLGPGRDFLPRLVWPTLGEFSTILFVSGGADKNVFDDLQAKYPGKLDDPEHARKVRFFMGDGAKDASYPTAKATEAELTKRGYKVTFVESDAVHGWPGFRYVFEQFAQSAFR